MNRLGYQFTLGWEVMTSQKLVRQLPTLNVSKQEWKVQRES